VVIIDQEGKVTRAAGSKRRVAGAIFDAAMKVVG
jgi:hypothetical protein